MVDVNGEPFLAHILKLVAKQGITKALILTGYRGQQIEDYFGKKFFGVEISYSKGSDSLSTGERILAASNQLESSFLLLYADNYVMFDLDALSTLMDSTKTGLVLTLCKKSPGNVVMGGNSFVSNYLLDRASGLGNFVEVGFSLASRDELLDALLESDSLLPQAIETLTNAGRVRAHLVDHPYFSVSDPKRLEKTRVALSQRLLLLVDRDGVINVKAKRGEYISSYKDFQKIERNWEALQELVKLN
jgi:NDP-sugar pyrophosphorylase family protein